MSNYSNNNGNQQQGRQSARIYVGRAKLHTFRNGDQIFKIWITPEGVEAICRNLRNGSANLIMTGMRQPDRAGNTEVIYIDDWQPEQRGGYGNRRGNHYDAASQRRGADRASLDSDPQSSYRQSDDGGWGDEPAPPPANNVPPDDDIEDEIPF